MEIFEAIILGLLQGLTEFLPVSSSGHIAIGKEILGIEASGDLMLEVVLHCATVLATIVVFRKQIMDLLRQLFRFRYNDGTDYILKICVSMIPVFVVGMFFKDAVEALFSSFIVVGIALMVTALLLFLSDSGLLSSRSAAKFSRTPSEEKPAPRNGISWWQAACIGIAQAVAVVPGLSRSGSTISTGLLCGVKRQDVAQFSFLMVLVPILGEASLDLVGGNFSNSSIGVAPLLAGFISAFVSGLFACRAMIALVKRAKLKWFAAYCALIGIAVIIYCCL